MQSRQFSQLTSTERKAKFIQVLISKSQGKLQKGELEAIASHRWQHASYRYPEVFDIVERQMTVTVHDDAKSFAQAATLQHTGLTHSWAGNDTFDQFGNWIVGKGKFGVYVNVTHSNNGNVGSPETDQKDPEFDLDKTQVIVVNSIDHDSLNQNATIHEEKWELHVIFKNSEYPVDPVVAEIIKRFAL